MNKFILAINIICIVIVIYLLYKWTKENVFGSESFINNRRFVTYHWMPGCPYCVKMWPTWKALRRELGGRGFVFRENNEEKERTPGIENYPTIRMVDELGNRRDYQGLDDFATLKEWMLSFHL
jgi:hypothetical protein